MSYFLQKRRRFPCDNKLLVGRYNKHLNLGVALGYFAYGAVVFCLVCLGAEFYAEEFEPRANVLSYSSRIFAYTRGKYNAVKPAHCRGVCADILLCLVSEHFKRKRTALVALFRTLAQISEIA